MPGAPVRWYRLRGEPLALAVGISLLGLAPLWLIVYGIGSPVRWALVIPGAVLLTGVAVGAWLPLRAGIGVTARHILIRQPAGRPAEIPWSQVTGFTGGKSHAGGRGDGERVFVLTSDGKRWHTVGCSTSRRSAWELWQLMRALEDERLARTPGAVSTLPAAPSTPAPRKPGAARFVGAFVLIAIGAGLLYWGATGLGPGLRAARGQGTAGYFIPQRATGRGGGALWYGEFRLPDGTVTLRNVYIADTSVTAVRAGVPVAARDAGAAGYVYPRDDPGAWHGTTGVLADGAWLWLTATVVIIQRVIHRPRRGRQDGNPAASPQPGGHPDLRIHHAWPREW
ncbi:MAG: hypothetical protein JWM19_6265 [Actinomycetia bacterium]|nr:hypothetical protein [Actinomycetes bacterium]